MLQRIIARMLRVVKLDHTVWGEIEADETANTEAVAIVVVAYLLSALGAALAPWLGGSVLARFFVTLILGVGLLWLLWAYVTMLVGTRLFGGETTFAEMARTLGYANAPRVLGILSAITCLGAIIGFVAWILSLVAGFFAVRESLDLPTDKSIITMVISGVPVWVLYSLVMAVIF